MRVYVAHSSAIDFQRDLYQPIKTSPLSLRHAFIFPHEAGSNPQMSKELIQSSDLVVAEVSKPSTGMGIELGWASDLGKRIICFFKYGTKPTQSLKFVSGAFVEYRDSQDFIAELAKHLGT